MSKELVTWYAKVLKSRYITIGIRCDLQKIDRLYSTLARLKFEIYNLRKKADVEYTAVCSVVTAFKDEKTRLVLEEKDKCIGLQLAAIKRNVDDIVESRTKLITSVIPLHEKFLQSDWLREVVFQLNLKYLHVKITTLLWVVV